MRTTPLFVGGKGTNLLCMHKIHKDKHVREGKTWSCFYLVRAVLLSVYTRIIMKGYVTTDAAETIGCWPIT